MRRAGERMGVIHCLGGDRPCCESVGRLRFVDIDEGCGVLECWTCGAAWLWGEAFAAGFYTFLRELTRLEYLASESRMLRDRLVEIDALMEHADDTPQPGAPYAF
jgi:hypothetical protein